MMKGYMLFVTFLPSEVVKERTFQHFSGTMSRQSGTIRPSVYLHWSYWLPYLGQPVFVMHNCLLLAHQMLRHTKLYGYMCYDLTTKLYGYMCYDLTTKLYDYMCYDLTTKLYGYVCYDLTWLEFPLGRKMSVALFFCLMGSIFVSITG